MCMSPPPPAPPGMCCAMACAIADMALGSSSGGTASRAPPPDVMLSPMTASVGLLMSPPMEKWGTLTVWVGEDDTPEEPEIPLPDCAVALLEEPPPEEFPPPATLI